MNRLLSQSIHTTLLLIAGTLIVSGAVSHATKPSSAKPDAPPAGSMSTDGSQVQIAPSLPSELTVHMKQDDEPKPWYQGWAVLQPWLGGYLLSHSSYGTSWSGGGRGMRQHLLDSLKWFSGETQPRSVGIAIVQANWDRHAFMRPYYLDLNDER